MHMHCTLRARLFLAIIPFLFLSAMSANCRAQSVGGGRHFSWDYAYDTNGQPRRDWTEATDGSWMERYANGAKSQYTLYQRNFLYGGKPGSLFLKDDKTIVVLVLNDLQTGQPLYFWQATDSTLNHAPSLLGKITVYGPDGAALQAPDAVPAPLATVPTVAEKTASNDAPDLSKVDLATIQQRAASGEPVAEVELGWRYARGVDGLTKDLAQAYVWYGKAADQGFAQGQMIIGQQYEYGTLVAKNPAMAVMWMQKACDQGYVRAIRHMGDYYRDGFGVTKDIPQAMVYFRKSAALGDAASDYNLGFLYLQGNGVQKDYAEARVWMERAWALRYYLAPGVIGDYYEYGYDMPVDKAASVPWYEQGGNLGDARSADILGDKYSEGSGVVRNDATAVLWYRKAADRGRARAQNNLAYMYQNGLGVTRDDAQAVFWYRKAAESGLALSQENLFNMYQDGRGVEKNDATALAWAMKAAAKGSARGEYQVCSAYLQGRGTAKDNAMAAGWCRKSADQGYALAEFVLGECYSDGEGVPVDINEARRWVQMAAKQNYPGAQKALDDLNRAPVQTAQADPPQQKKHGFFSGLISAVQTVAPVLPQTDVIQNVEKVNDVAVAMDGGNTLDLFNALLNLNGGTTPGTGGTSTRAAVACGNDPTVGMYKAQCSAAGGLQMRPCYMSTAALYSCYMNAYGPSNPDYAQWKAGRDSALAQVRALNSTAPTVGR